MINFMVVKFLQTARNNGVKNMELDEKMLSDAISGNYNFATIRFYEWSPKCISLGKNQNDNNFIDSGIDVVRRKTGGRALLHDSELTYSIAAPILKGESVIQTYKRVSNCLISGFEKLGIKLEYASDKGGAQAYCMNISSGADVSYNGKKLIGSAQYRSQGYFLQHGSILFDADFELLEKIFDQKVDRNKIATLNEISNELNKAIAKEELIEALKWGFKQEF